MRTEKVLAVIILIGFAFWKLNWHGGSLILMVSLLILSVLYCYFAFYFFSDRSIKQQNLAVSIVSGVLLSIIPVGILFRLLHWKGGQPMLVIGVFSAVVVLILVAFLRSKNISLRNYYNNMLTRSSVLGFLALILVLTSPITLYKIQFSGEPTLSRLMIRQHLHPENPAYRDSIDAFYRGEIQ